MSDNHLPQVDNVNLRCAKVLELTEALIGRVLTESETFAFKQGYFSGYIDASDEQLEALKKLNNLTKC